MALRPNIVFFLADDLGYGDLGVYGQRRIPTPHLDRMARDGMRFTQHYAGCTVCAPSRGCLLTGLHTGHSFIRGNGPVQLREDPQDRCVARMLKEVGYRTALIGKSGLSGNVDDGAHPLRKGFDRFYGFVSHEAAHRHYPTDLFDDGRRVTLPGNRGKDGSDYADALFLERALEFVGESDRRPFFLHVASTLPHADLAAPEAFRAPFRGRFPETPFAGGHYRAEPAPRATYAGMVSFLDHMVGALRERLRTLGIARDTLFLFASDNGAMQEGGYSPEFFRSSGTLRGGKRDLYEGGIRTPLIAAWPGSVAAGARTDLVSAFWDFPATACELAGAPSPTPTDGISYAPTLLGKPGEQRRHESLYWEFHEQGGKRAVRWGDWKAVQRDVERRPDGPIEIYDLRRDPGERHDLATRRPEVVAEARRRLDTRA